MCWNTKRALHFNLKLHMMSNRNGRLKPKLTAKYLEKFEVIEKNKSELSNKKSFLSRKKIGDAQRVHKKMGIRKWH